MVTLDGPAGAGKSSLAKRLARRLNLLYLESGAFYRAVALMAGRQQGDLLSSQWLGQFLETFQLQVYPGADGLIIMTDGQDISLAIREPQVSQGASLVATLRPVRQWVQASLARFCRDRRRYCRRTGHGHQGLSGGRGENLFRRLLGGSSPSPLA